MEGADAAGWRGEGQGERGGLSNKDGHSSSSSMEVASLDPR